MDATMRATCPTCRSALRIPAEWAGQPVKCKNCGAVVRTKGRPAQAAGTAEAAQLDAMGTNGHPAPAAFTDLNLPAPAPKYNPFEGPETVAPPPVMYDPATGQPLPPGYPYPYPYPAPVPGYPYPYPPAGYPYPVPPGAAPPAAYPYPQPHPGAAPVAAPAPGYPMPVPAQPYPQPVAYPQPVPVPQPDPVPASGEFKPSEATAAYSGRGRGAYRRHRGPNKLFWVVVCLFLAVGLVLALTFGTKFIKSRIGDPAATANNTDDQNKGQPAPPGPNPPKTGGGLVANAGPTPRRLLFIHVSNYLYLNPLTSAAQIGDSKGGDLTRPAASRLAYEWRIPNSGDNNQVFLVSDTAPPPDGRAPFKNVITGAYERFFETSRAQDRIVVYFGGHVLAKAKDDKEVVYLVPMEGDPDDPASLISLDEFYAKLTECKATQKVVIWDVCRFNPERGRQRPGSEPMAEAVAKALAAPPAGVQAVLTCQPGENALEFYNQTPPDVASNNKRLMIAGSSFLDAVRHVSDKKGSAKNLGPNDPFPVDELAAAVSKRVGEVAAFADSSAKQTVKVAGAPPETLVAFNADESFAKRFDLPAPPKGVAPAEIADITSVLTLPGIKQDSGDYPLANFPFPEELMRPYKSDVPLAELLKKENRENQEFREKYLFRITVLESMEMIRTVWGKGGMQLRDSFSGETSDAVKKEILKEQDYPADVIPRLDRVIALLEAVEPMKANEPKLWQAHYEYALGQAKARFAYMQEYNLSLGSIRTEVLPQLDPKKGEDGYKLISAEKLRVKDAIKAAEEAREHFQKLIDEYKGTPWAILARRDRAINLGLAWKPFSSQKPDADPK